MTKVDTKVPEAKYKDEAIEAGVTRALSELFLVKQSRPDTAMSTIHRITELRPATAQLQVYSPLEKYWNAFQEWRKREKLRTRLCRLTDSELADIGITRGEIDYVVSNRSIDPTGVRSP